MRARLDKLDGMAGFEQEIESQVLELEECSQNSTAMGRSPSSCFCQPTTKAVPSYLVDSFYDHHLERWLSHFPREDFLFLSNRELKDDTERVMRRVEEFLGLPRHHYGEILEKQLNSRGEGQRSASILSPAMQVRLTALFQRTIDATLAVTGVDVAP